MNEAQHLRFICYLKYSVFRYIYLNFVFTNGIHGMVKTVIKGVYQNSYPARYGKHVIKIIGWGVEEGVHYWLCVNSWNEHWGDKGLFKILRGSKECEIENEITAGRMKV